MVKVKKNNKELTIHEIQKESYLALGYSVIDENGIIVEHGNATGIAELKAENTTLKAENIELKAENIELKSKNAELEKQLTLLKEKETSASEDQEKKQKNKA